MTDELIFPADPAAAYWTGQLRPGHPALFAEYDAESAATLRTLRPVLDVPYGPHPREAFDVFPAAGAPTGTLVYFHGGYWQSRDKAQFRFLAPAFAGRSVDVVLANYPLCPDVALEAVVGSALSGLPAVLAHPALRRDGARPPLVLAGHSAGGHLAIELALAGRERGFPPVAGVLAVSGVFELVPLLRTPVNDRLMLDEARAAALSPLRRVAGPLPPAVFVVGADETPAFQRQSAAAHEAWLAAGAASRLVSAAGADHYSVLRRLAPGHAAFEAAMALFAPRP